MNSWAGLAIGVAGLLGIILLIVLAWLCENKQRRRIGARIRKNQKIIDSYPRSVDEKGHPPIEETDECLRAFRENADLKIEYRELPRF